MFKNSTSVIGYCIAGAGWFWLLAGSSSDVGLGRNVINIHSTMMALATILTGIGISLAGFLNFVSVQIQGNKKPSKQPSSNNQAIQKNKANKPDIEVEDIDDAELFRRKMMERGINT